MSAPPPKKGLKNCQVKIRYGDEMSARANISVLCEQHGTSRMFLYKCPHCLGWHATRNFKPNSFFITPENTFDKH